MDLDDATVTRSRRHPTSFPHQSRTTDTLSQREDSESPTTSNMTSTKFGKKRAPIPKILLHPDPTHADDTAARSKSLEGSALVTVTSDKLSSPESPRTLRRTKKGSSLSGVARPTADSLAPPDPIIPLSPPPVSTSYQSDLPHIHFMPPDSHTGHRKPLGAINTSLSITHSPPTPPSPTCTSPGTQLSSPVLPRIGTHKRPYYSTVRASMNSRTTFDSSPLSSPPASPYSTTFPITSSAQQSRSSVSANFGRSETSLAAEQFSPTLTCGSVSPYSNDQTQAPIVTVPPLPPLSPPYPSTIPFQIRTRPPSPKRGTLPVLDLTQDEDEDEDEDDNGDYYGQFGKKVRLVKYLGTKKSGNAKEKVKNPLSLSLSSGRRRGRSFGFGSDKAKEVIHPLPALLTSRSFTGLGPAQGGSMSGEMELRMRLAERDLNSGNENGRNLTPSFKFRENPRPSVDKQERSEGRSGGKKLVKTRSSAGLTANLSPDSSPAPGPSKPRIGIRLREMMGGSLLNKLQGNKATRA